MEVVGSNPDPEVGDCVVSDVGVEVLPFSLLGLMVELGSSDVVEPEVEMGADDERAVLMTKVVALE